MKKRIIALILIGILMISTTIGFAHEDDVPKICSPYSIPYSNSLN